MKENICLKCDFHFDEPDGETWSYTSKCRRLQTVIYCPVNNYPRYQGKLLDCNSERECSLTFKERIFGSNKDKCGREGKYFQEKRVK